MLPVGQPTLAGQLEDVGIQRGEKDHAPRRRVEEGPSGRRDHVEATEVVKDLLAPVPGGSLDGGQGLGGEMRIDDPRHQVWKRPGHDPLTMLVVGAARLVLRASRGGHSRL